MSNVIKKYRWYIVGAFLLAIAYFSLRLTNLTHLPIFTDEAIYIRWAQIGGRDSEWRFISLVDGKQPMAVWAMMATTRLIEDPLFAGRLVSVITGFFTMIGMAVLAWELFKSRRIAILSSLLYLTSPFALIYDRMALMDSMVAMFSIWSLFLAIALVKRVRLDIALILGMSLGGAVLTKTNGLLNVYMLPAVFVLFDFKIKHWKPRLAKLIGLVAIAVIFSQVYYSILRLSPLFHMIEQKDGTFIYRFDEWIEHPVRFLWGNMKGILDWVYTYVTLPIMLLVIGALAKISVRTREKALLTVWFAAPVFALALFGKVLYPRFIFFMTLPLLILAAWSIDTLMKRIKRPMLQIGLLALIIAFPLYVESKILFSIVTAPIPKSDSNQYINDWPAGWGVREAVDFFILESQDKKIVVYTDGTFGLMPYGFEIYLVDDPNIAIKGIWPAPEFYTEEMVVDIAEATTYYVANREQELPPSWNAKELAKYKKGLKHRFLRIYQLFPAK